MEIEKLPSLDDTKALDIATIRSFRENGHVLIPGILNREEVKAYRDIIKDAAYKYNTETRAMEERDTYGKAFLQIMNLWEVDKAVKKFTLAKRFAKIAADLLGVEQVRIYHDQALYKEAGGGLTPWHQDQYYWPIDTPDTVTMWMPLIDITEEMGMLTFASGTHEKGFVGDVAISDESEKMLDAYVKQNGFTVTRPQTMNAGDATWHYGWTLHCAPGNASPTTREVMTIIYFADGAKVITPKNENQEADRQRWLCGAAPGTKAASALNPLVT